MARLFTALEIPAAAGFHLSLLKGGLPGARWIDPANYHVTLRFIGEIENWPENFFGDQMADIAGRTLAAMRRRQHDQQGAAK